MNIILETNGTKTVLGNCYWSYPTKVDIIEKTDSIEVIYKETAHFGSEWNRVERVFKIVFSCVDGKWNKSERIYGEIAPAQPETYVWTEKTTEK
jgi:hypothetical protein